MPKKKNRSKVGNVNMNNNSKNPYDSMGISPDAPPPSQCFQTEFLLCGRCSKSQVQLRCFECKEIFYWSVDSQKIDRANHEKHCKAQRTLSELKPNPAPLNPTSSASTPEAESCDSCGKSGVKLSKCSKCLIGKYCCRNCQKLDWPKHKKNCQSKKENSASTTSTNEQEVHAESCDSCGKSGVKLSYCSKCLIGKYCCRNCQKLDWPKHKKNCQSKKENSASTTSINKQEVHGVGCYCGGDYCKYDAELLLRNVLHETMNDFPFTILFQAIKRFPGFKLVTQLESIPREFSFELYPAKQVFIGLMFQRGWHPFRPSMIIRDKYGNLANLIFYLDGEESDFPWYKFKPGNYICIIYPMIHAFIDGTSGFRIESTKSVWIIEA